jgi:hypothetical protein
MSIDPERFEVGEFVSEDGEVGLMLSFESEGKWTRYRLHPMTAIEIVRAISAWLDEHSEGGNSD